MATLTIAQLLAIASAALQANGNPEKIQPREIVAFAMVESSLRNLPPYLDGQTQAFGLYGFHLARWRECGKRREDWGRADAVMQTRVMVQSLTRYYRSAKRAKAPDRLQWAAHFHNAGHGESVETAYTAKLRRALREIPD